MGRAYFPAKQKAFGCMSMRHGEDASVRRGSARA
jgi:hypothetical protein